MDPDSRRPPSRTRRHGAPALAVSVSDGRGRPVAGGGLARWLAGVAPATARGEVAIALVSDARMRALNRGYRRKDYATDVLSFPADRASRTADGGLLGDIVIATGVARRQAREAGHSYQAELRVLALHGLLHLLGYDHERRTDRGRMVRAEARLRRRGGLPAGLIERALPFDPAAGPPGDAQAARRKAGRARSARLRPAKGPRGQEK